MASSVRVCSRAIQARLVWISIHVIGLCASLFVSHCCNQDIVGDLFAQFVLLAAIGKRGAGIIRRSSLVCSNACEN